MKVFVALFVVAFIAVTQAFTEEQLTKLKVHIDKCTKESGVDTELILKARKGEFSNNEKLRHYYYCVMKAIGIINENAEPQLDVIRQKIGSDVKKDDVEKVITACKDLKGADKFDSAQKLFECYYTSTPQHLTFA